MTEHSFEHQAKSVWGIIYRLFRGPVHSQPTLMLPRPGILSDSLIGSLLTPRSHDLNAEKTDQESQSILRRESKDREDTIWPAQGVNLRACQGQKKKPLSSTMTYSSVPHQMLKWVLRFLGKEVRPYAALLLLNTSLGILAMRPHPPGRGSGIRSGRTEREICSDRLR